MTFLQFCRCEVFYKLNIRNYVCQTRLHYNEGEYASDLLGVEAEPLLVVTVLPEGIHFYGNKLFGLEYYAQLFKRVSDGSDLLKLCNDALVRQLGGFGYAAVIKNRILNLIV